jgi:type I restriction enzyme S subunit
MKPSGVDWLGDVPAHWEICRIASVYQEINEAGNDHLPILTVSIHDGVSDRQLAEDELDRKVNRSEDGSKYKRVEPGDLVYNMMRAWQGGFGAVTVPGQISPAYVVARPKRQVSSRFIELLLRTPQAIEEVRCSSYGVADFRLRLYWEKFKDIRVAIPPVEEQTRILKHIETICKKIDNLINSSTVAIATLLDRRSALISAAVTGKIDVRNYTPKEAA